MVAGLLVQAATVAATSIVAGIGVQAMHAANEKAKQRGENGKSTRSCDPCPAADTCKKLKDAQDKATLSEHVYSKSGTEDNPAPPLPPGYSEVSESELKKMGFTTETFAPSRSDFRAQMYKKTSETGETEYVVAFKGTESGADWGENFKQGLGANSDYYNRAKKISKKMQILGHQTSYTGHSLGGGLASAAAANTNAKGTTFNAAGLHTNTVNHKKSSAEIDAYYVPGDALSTLQDNREGVLAGGLVAATAASPRAGLQLVYNTVKNEISGKQTLPRAAGRRIPLPVAMPPGKSGMTYYNPVSRHGMDWVQEGISKEMEANGCQ
jgi:hypothetical protein